MATTLLKKELIISEDIDLGMGGGSGTRGGKQVNATNIPYNSSTSIADELEKKLSRDGADLVYANKLGDENVLFSVKAGSGSNAMPKSQFDSLITEYPKTDQVVAALTTKADKNGNTELAFNVHNPVFDPNGPFPATTESVNFGYMQDWFTGVVQPGLNGKADKSEIISKVDEPDTPYTPTEGYHPANKKYVDDKVLDIGAGDMTRAEFVENSSAFSAVYTTKFLGNFGSTNGVVDADKGVLKLSQVIITDANAITDLGIGIFIGVDIQNSPPASAGIPVAIEQMDMDGTGTLLGQRCTTDIGVFTRFGYDTARYSQLGGNGTQAIQWTPWAHTLQETDYAHTYAGGTVKMTVEGTNCSLTNDGSDALIP